MRNPDIRWMWIPAPRFRKGTSFAGMTSATVDVDNANQSIYYMSFGCFRLFKDLLDVR